MRKRTTWIGLAAAAAIILAVVYLWTAPEGQLRPEIRPAGVPQDVEWYGGADGGAYIRCGIDEVRNVNQCAVWNDFTGALVEAGDYRLVPQNRAASSSELRMQGADFGGSIYLKHGLVLKRE